MSTQRSFSEVVREWAHVFMHQSFHDFKGFMDDADLSPSQVNTLMRLYHHGSCGVSDIGEHAGISNAAASQMVERLVQLGLLQRQENSDDRRAKQLTITQQGRALIEKGIQARSQWMEQLTTALSSEEQVMIAQALSLLTQAARHIEYKEQTGEGL